MKSQINQDGYILVTDVVNFSILDVSRQGEIVDHLWDFLSGPATKRLLLELGENSPDSIEQNDTGDGFLLVCPAGQPQKLLQLAEALHGHAGRHKAQEAPIQLRIALHTGIYCLKARPTDAGHAERRIYGAGPNDCSRLLAYCDGGQIVVSEDFAKKCHSFDGKLSRMFNPPMPEPAVEIVVKHGKFQYIRHYLGALRRKASFVWPRRLEERDEAEEFLWRELCFVGGVFENELLELGLSPERIAKLGWRIALFKPDAESTDRIQRRFVPVAQGDEDGRDGLIKATLNYRKRSSHPIGPRVKLPVVAAFRDKKPAVVHKLPTYGAATKNRHAAALGLPASHVATFSRHACTYLGIPLLRAKQGVEVVLCIDLIDPLEDMPQGKLLEMARTLQGICGSSLLLAWLYKKEKDS